VVDSSGRAKRDREAITKADQAVVEAGHHKDAEWQKRRDDENERLDSLTIIFDFNQIIPNDWTRPRLEEQLDWF